MTTNSKHKQIVACIRKQLHNVMLFTQGNIEEKQLRLTLAVELHFVTEQIQNYHDNILNVKTAKVLTKSEIREISKNLVEYFLILPQASTIFENASQQVKDTTFDEIYKTFKNLDDCLETGVGYINKDGKFVYVFENKRLFDFVVDFQKNAINTIKEHYDINKINQLEKLVDEYIKHSVIVINNSKRNKTFVDDNTSIKNINLESGSQNRKQNYDN